MVAELMKLPTPPEAQLRCAQHFAEIPPERIFETGLELVLDGIETRRKALRRRE
jgi:hypothetical protein